MHFFLSALARLTGALDGFGEPLVFDTAGDNPLEDEIVAAILAAIAATVTVPIDIKLMTSGVVPAGLAVGILPAVVPDVGPGDQACFGVKFTGTDSPVGSFDLNFKDDMSGAVLGTIPVDVDCPESPESVLDDFKCYIARQAVRGSFKQSVVSLTVTSEKNGVPSDLNLDHFRCYDAGMAAGATFEQQVVTLSDQFVSRVAIVQAPVALCNPVDKNGEGIKDETAHLTCYKLNRAKTGDELRNATTENQFGQLKLMAKIGRVETLCVPSKKREVE